MQAFRVLTLSQLSLIKKSSGARFQPGLTRGIRAATGGPKSFDPKTRTFEFVLASEKPCRTWRVTSDWDFIEVDEILPMSALVDIDEFVGNGIFEDHRSWRAPIGSIQSARIEGDKLVCTGKLSGRDDVKQIAQDIQDGIRQAFSVGFEILKDGNPVVRAGDVDLITVKRWRAKEASLVTVPADDSAKIRSAAGARTPSRTRGTSVMPMDADTFKTRMAEMFAGLTDEIVGLLGSDADGDENPGTPPANQVDDAAGGLTAAQRTAKLRSIRDVCKKRGFEAEFSALEATDASLDKFQDLLIASLRTSDTEIDTTARPGAGQRGKLLSFSETTRGKAAK